MITKLGIDLYYEPWFRKGGGGGEIDLKPHPHDVISFKSTYRVFIAKEY